MRVLLFDSEMSIGYKDFYGQYKISRFSLFELEKINNESSSLEIKLLKSKELSIKYKCPFCGNNHNFSYTISDFVKREIVAGGCENLGLPLFFIGNSANIEQIVEKYKKVGDKLYAML